MKQFTKIITITALLITAVIGINTFTQQKFSTASNDYKGNLQKNNALSLLSAANTCSPDNGYDTCYSNSYSDHGVTSEAEIHVETLSKTVTSDQTLDYKCTGDKTVLINEYNAQDFISSWEKLSFNTGETLNSNEGSIDVEKLEDDFTLVCADKDTADNGAWTATWVGYYQEGFNIAAHKPKIQTYKKTEVTGGKKQIKATVYLENTGADMQQQYLVELAPQKKSSLSFLSFIGDQETCDQDTPKNVHKDYKLRSGEKVSITLTSKDLKPGKYDVKLVSTTGCSNVDSSVSATGPFGWGQVVETVNVESANTPPEITGFDFENNIVEDEPVSVSVKASDADGDALSYEWTGGKKGKSVSYVFEEPGERTVSVTVSDGKASVSDSVSFTVSDKKFVRWLPPSSGDQCVKKTYTEKSGIPSDAFESEKQCEDSLDTGDGLFANLWNSISSFFGGLI